MTALPDPESTATVDRTPPRTSAVLAALAALIVCIATLPTIGVVPAVIGLAIIATGLAAGRRGLVTTGAAAQLLALFVTGAADVDTARVLVGLAAAVVAWDVGQHAVGLGEQIGRSAPSRRAELVHAGTSLGVAAGTAGVAYFLFLAAAGNQPTTALVALLLAAVLIVLALRN